MLALNRFGPVSRGAVVPPVSLNAQANASGQQNSILPILQAILSTAETQILSGPVPQIPLSCALHPATQTEQVKFNFDASGYITTTSTTNITLGLYAGVSTTIGSNTLLKASTATAQNGTTGTPVTAPWWIHADLIYDSVSGLLCGVVGFYINKVLIAAATLTNFPTGISNLNDPVEAFSMTITSSAGASGTPTTINVANFSCG
jgi:hypothetical protein